MDLNKRFKKDTRTVELSGDEGESPARFHFLDPNSRQGTYLLAENLTPREYNFLESGDMSGLNTISEAIDVQVKIVKSLLQEWESLQADGKDLAFNAQNKDWLFKEYPSLGVDLFESLFAGDQTKVAQETEVKKSSKKE